MANFSDEDISRKAQTLTFSMMWQAVQQQQKNMETTKTKKLITAQEVQKAYRTARELLIWQSPSSPTVTDSPPQQESGQVSMTHSMSSPSVGHNSEGEDEDDEEVKNLSCGSRQPIRDTAKSPQQESVDQGRWAHLQVPKRGAKNSSPTQEKVEERKEESGKSVYRAPNKKLASLSPVDCSRSATPSTIVSRSASTTNAPQSAATPVSAPARSCFGTSSPPAVLSTSPLHSDKKQDGRETPKEKPKAKATPAPTPTSCQGNSSPTAAPLMLSPPCVIASPCMVAAVLNRAVVMSSADVAHLEDVQIHPISLDLSRAVSHCTDKSPNILCSSNSMTLSMKPISVIDAAQLCTDYNLSIGTKNKSTHSLPAAYDDCSLFDAKFHSITHSSVQEAAEVKEEFNVGLSTPIRKVVQVPCRSAVITSPKPVTLNTSSSSAFSKKDDSGRSPNKNEVTRSPMKPLLRVSVDMPTLTDLTESNGGKRRGEAKSVVVNDHLVHFVGNPEDLPPRCPEKTRTLVLELDDTLVRIPTMNDNAVPRPHMPPFFDFIGKAFEVIIWTTSDESRALKTLQQIDTQGVVTGVVFRHPSWFVDAEFYSKNVSLLHRPDDSVLLIDASSLSVSGSAANGICVWQFIELYENWGTPALPSDGGDAMVEMYNNPSGCKHFSRPCALPLLFALLQHWIADGTGVTEFLSNCQLLHLKHCASEDAEWTIYCLSPYMDDELKHSAQFFHLSQLRTQSMICNIIQQSTCNDNRNKYPKARTFKGKWN